MERSFTLEAWTLIGPSASMWIPADEISGDRIKKLAYSFGPVGIVRCKKFNSCLQDEYTTNLYVCIFYTCLVLLGQCCI